MARTAAPTELLSTRQNAAGLFLRKLPVRSTTEASAEAVRLGLVAG